MNGGKKNLTFAILAEESLLFPDCLCHGHSNARKAELALTIFQFAAF